MGIALAPSIVNVQGSAFTLLYTVAIELHPYRKHITSMIHMTLNGHDTRQLANMFSAEIFRLESQSIVSVNVSSCALVHVLDGPCKTLT